MNRKLAFSIAILIALVGVALVGGENTAMARGCHGCFVSACACDCGACHATCGCHRMGLLARMRARRAARRCHCACYCHCYDACHHACHGCNGCHGGNGHDGGPEYAPEEEAPAPDAAAAVPAREQFGFREVSFRR